MVLNISFSNVNVQLFKLRSYLELDYVLNKEIGIGHLSHWAAC